MTERQHSRSLKVSLVVAAGWALTACIPATSGEPPLDPQGTKTLATSQPRKITAEEIALACQATAPLSPQNISPHGFTVQERLVRVPNPKTINTEPMNSRIVLIDSHGNKFPLTTNPDVDDGQPQLSSDGQRVAFVRRGPFAYRHAGIEGLYTINIYGLDGHFEGVDERRLTTTRPKVSENFPNWSPDGQRIVFARRTHGDFPRQAELMMVNSDGTGLKSLAQTTSTTMDEGDFPAIFFPAFSPNGNKIAYRDWHSTYVIGADGRDNRLVSGGVSLESPEGVDRQHVWLLNSQQVVVYKQYQFTNVDLRNRKFVYNIDGSGSADLTPICPPANAMPT